MGRSNFLRNGLRFFAAMCRGVAFLFVGSLAILGLGVFGYAIYAWHSGAPWTMDAVKDLLQNEDAAKQIASASW